ncbi:MAG: hypothetical protein IJS28_07275 [Synergistaceae bacterium]|nr:hypothetical protein [Synergistaceae bacterium]
MKYEDSSRGKIQYRDRARQLIDFSGIKYGRITPTDIDGFLEYKGKAFVFYEYKLPEVEMPDGQGLALTRMVDVLSTAGKEAVLFLCRHNETNPNKDIIGSDAIVEGVYWHGKWHQGAQQTVKQQTDKFIQWVNRKSKRNGVGV